MNFLRLSDVDLAGKRVFIRADFNVPFNADGSLSDDTRIRATLPGILACLVMLGIAAVLEGGSPVTVTGGDSNPLLE